MCYLYFFCLHCCLINIHIFDYPDSRLSGLFTEVPTSPDNRGSTYQKSKAINLKTHLISPRDSISGDFETLPLAFLPHYTRFWRELKIAKTSTGKLTRALLARTLYLGKGRPHVYIYS